MTRIILALLLLLSTAAHASCNVYAEQTFDPVCHTTALALGESCRVHLRLFSQGPTATIRRVMAMLDCPYDQPYFGCTDPANRALSYVGPVTTNCPTTWSSGHFYSPYPNDVIFEAATPFAVAPGQECWVEYTMRRVGGSGTVHTLSGFRLLADDAVCLDGGRSSGIDSNQIWLAP